MLHILYHYPIVYSYKRILVLISHSQDFLNGVCTNIIHINKKRLKYYTGNYDAFVRTRMELLENQMKQYNWEQDQINHMKVSFYFPAIHSMFFNNLAYIFRITLQDSVTVLRNWLDRHSPKKRLLPRWWLKVLQKKYPQIKRSPFTFQVVVLFHLLLLWFKTLVLDTMTKHLGFTKIWNLVLI